MKKTFEFNGEKIELIDMNEEIIVFENDKYKDVQFVELKAFDKLPAEIKVRVLNEVDGVREIAPAKIYGFFKPNWKKAKWNDTVYEPVKLHFATFKKYEVKAKDRKAFENVEDFIKYIMSKEKKDGKKRHSEWVEYRKYWFDGDEYVVDGFKHRIEAASAKWLKRKDLGYYKSNFDKGADIYLFNLINGGYNYGD